MLKASYWISVVSAPMLLASTGCAILNRPLAAEKHSLPAERMMTMAKTLERQGHMSQAKNTYRRILAANPDHQEAQQSLETLIAKESNRGQRRPGPTSPAKPETMLAHSKENSNLREQELKELKELQELRKQIAKLASEEAENLKLQRRAIQERLQKESDLASAESRNTANADESVAVAQASKSNAIKPVSSERPGPATSRVLSAASEESDDFPSPFDVNVAEKPAVRSESKTIAGPPQDLRQDLANDRGEPGSVERQTDPAMAGRLQQYIDDLDEAESDTSEVAVQPPITTVDLDALQLPSPALAEPTLPRLATAEVTTSQSRTVPADSVELPPESADIVEFLPPVADALDAADADVAVVVPEVGPAESDAEFVKPIIRDEQPGDDPLAGYFGEFKASLVEEARLHRVAIQDKLVGVVVNQNAESAVRSRAIFLLGAMGPAASDAIPALRREMHYDTDEYLRIDLSEAILKIHPEDEDAIQVLVDCLKDTDEQVRWIAAYALRNGVSERTTFVIDALHDALNIDDPKLRRMIFLTLAEFGPAAAKAIPQLEAALDSPDSATREVAKASLACIAPDRKTTRNVRVNATPGYAVNK